MEYRGTKLYFDEKDEKWYYLDAGERIESKSIAELKRWIDKKLKGDFERIPVLCHQSRWGGERDEIVKGEITSVSPDGDVWLKRGAKDHAQKCRETVYAYTEKNLAIFAEFKAEKKKQQEAEDRADKLLASMEEVNTDELRKKYYA